MLKPSFYLLSLDNAVPCTAKIDMLFFKIFTMLIPTNQLLRYVASSSYDMVCFVHVTVSTSLLYKIEICFNT